MRIDQVKILKQLESQNARLKRALADYRSYASGSS